MTFFIFAGEASGDLHGSRLIPCLTGEKLVGVGGPLMRQAGLETLYPMEDFRVMGFTDVLKAFPKLWSRFRQIKQWILTNKPSCVILIDYPGFNLRLAKALKKAGYQGKIVQYICPTVWAHGKGRIEIMEQNLDLLLTIYPFEASYFQNTKLPVCYIGCPLVETIDSYSYDPEWRVKNNIPADAKIYSIFPGSRIEEIHRNLPKQLAALKMLQLDSKSHIAISVKAERDFIHEMVQDINNVHLIPAQYTYELMKESQLALAKSGTVVLELALHGTPTVVTYELSWLNYLIARYILRLRLPYYSMPNILLGKELYPECIGKNISSETIYQNLKKIDREKIQKECKELRQCLGSHRSNETAAQAIKSLFP